MTKRMKALKAAVAAAALAGMPLAYATGAAGAPGAGSYPERPVRLVVPYAVGGATDVIARVAARYLGETLGQPVVVENRPGAGGSTGSAYAAKQPADGYTLVCVANSFTANKTLVKNLPYDTTRDLKPVALMGLSEHVLATHPGSGLKTLADLRSRAKARPGELSYASFGNGTSAHLSGALLCQEMGIDMVHIPYKGQGPALADLLGGQVDVMFGNWPEFRGHVQSGKLVALGMATRQRSQFAPQVPTLAEQGVALESNSWQGLLAPGATPDALVQRINASVVKALAEPAVVDAFARGGIVSQAGTAQQFAAFVTSEIAKYEAIIRRANITLG